MPWETVPNCVNCGCPGGGVNCCGCVGAITSRYWRLNINGITNNGCQFCNNYNGSFLLDSFHDCNYRSCGILTDICTVGQSEPQHPWSLLREETYYRLSPAGFGFSPAYYIPLEQWNCVGPNTLLLSQDAPVSCTGFPPAVTLTPEGGNADSCRRCDICPGPAPRQFRVTGANSFFDFACDNCNLLNTSHILTATLEEPCVYALTLSNGGLCTFRIELEPDFLNEVGGPCYMLLRITGSKDLFNTTVWYYRRPKRDFNCNGTNVFSFVRVDWSGFRLCDSPNQELTVAPV